MTNLQPEAPPFFQPRRPPRRRPPGANLSAPPAALVLVAAELFTDPVSGDVTVSLTFDRPVDTAGLVASQITVEDEAGAGWAYAGTGVAALPGPQTIVVALATTGPASGETRLNATAATGIVAVDDGGTWAGVVDRVLPYP